jgi:hydrogenase 3 maturation protease
MPKSSWQAALSMMLRRLHRPDRPTKVIVVGMGQTLRGDDALGPVVAGDLQGSLMEGESVMILDTGPAPENFTGAIRRFGPDLVLLVDAAELGESAGKIQLLDQRACTGVSASTHSLPPSVIADYLSREMDCEIALLGIQSFRTDVGLPLSDPVRSAADRVVAGIIEAFSMHGIAAQARLQPTAGESGVGGLPGARLGARVLEDV